MGLNIENVRPLGPRGPFIAHVYELTLPQHIRAEPVITSRPLTKDSSSLDKRLTSSNRFTSARAFTNWLMLPFDIHLETIANWVPDITTPRSGNMFG